jgi:hypothetical protein
MMGAVISRKVVSGRAASGVTAGFDMGSGAGISTPRREGVRSGGVGIASVGSPSVMERSGAVTSGRTNADTCLSSRGFVTNPEAG